MPELDQVPHGVRGADAVVDEDERGALDGPALADDDGTPRRWSAASVASSVPTPHEHRDVHGGALDERVDGARGVVGRDAGDEQHAEAVLAQGRDEAVEHLDGDGSRNARRSWSPTTTPTTPDRPERSWRPSGFGPVYPSSFAASRTRAGLRVIGPAPENASDAVETETPASSATLASVGR